MAQQIYQYTISDSISQISFILITFDPINHQLCNVLRLSPVLEFFFWHGSSVSWRVDDAGQHSQDRSVLLHERGVLANGLHQEVGGGLNHSISQHT